MNIQQAHQQAHKALQSSSFQEAESIYKAILNSSPQDQQAKFGLSILALEFNKPDNALDYLQPLLTQNPEEKAYRIQWLKVAFSKAQYSDVLQQASAWSSQTPCPELYLLAGNSARALGNWDQAEEQYNQGLYIQSEHPEIHAELALLEAMRPRGNLAEAQNKIFTLAENHPQVPSVLKNAAHIFLLNHNTKLAEPLLKLAFKLNGRDPETLALRAKWLHQTGELESSKKAFAQAINICSNNFLAYAHIGWLFVDMSRLYDAIFCFTKAVNNQPAFYQEADKLAELLHYHSNDPTKAIQALNKAIPVNPGWGRLYARKAFMQWVNKNLDNPLEEAKATLEKGLKNCVEDGTEIHVVRSALAASEKDWETLRQARRKSQNNNFYGLGSYAHALEKTERGNYKGAEKAIKQALKIVPNLSFYQYTQAQMLIRLQKPQKAIEILENIVKYHPTDPDYRRMLIDLLAQVGRKKEALQHESILMENNPNACENIFWERLLRDPDNPQHNYAYAKLLSKQPERGEEALSYVDSALKIYPNSHKLLILKGNILRNMEYFDEAEETFSQVLKHYPESAIAYVFLAQVLLMREKWEEAETASLKGYDIKKDYGTIFQLAQTLRDLGGHIDKVLELFDKAIALKPNNPEAKWEKAFTCFHNNRLSEAMELYHHGFEAGARKPYRQFNVPEWDGKADLRGKKILCWREQGIGDEIRDSRCFQSLINTGAHCIFEVNPKLKPLFKRSFPDAEVVIARGGNDLFRTDIDYHIPAGTLKRYFPHECPEPPVYKNFYILNEEYLQKWGERLEALGEGLKVGICWRSGFQNARRKKSYMDIEDLEPLFKLPGIFWINLQYDECQEELDEARERFGVLIHNWPDLDQKDDLDQTAAMASLLDLAIGSHTTPAVMCSNLGIPYIAWNLNSTLARNIGPVRSHLDYPLLLFSRHYMQSKKRLTQKIADYIDQNWL